MITSVRFQNFKALRDVSIDLERFTVLVGPNASGKTSVLQGLAYAHFPVHSSYRSFKGDRSPATLRSSGADGDVAVHCTEQLKNERFALHLVFEDHGLQEESYFAVTLKYERNDGRTFSFDESAGHDDQHQDELFDDLLAPVNVLRLDAARLAAPAYSNALRPRIGPDGRDLAPVLAEMLISSPATFHRVEESLRAVIPLVEHVRLVRAPVRRQETQTITVDGRAMSHVIEREYVGYQIVFDMRGAPNLPAHAVSEGTLIMLGILTAIAQEPGPQVLLIDDLERAIHPRALIDLLAQIRKLLELFPDLQMVATSHSPYLVDLCQPEEVRLMLVDENGSALCARLDQHPEFERWKSFMRPGEIWSMVGESWIGNGGKASHG